MKILKAIPADGIIEKYTDLRLWLPSRANASG